MARLLYVHWNEKEAEERAKALRKAGHKLRVHWSSETQARLGDDLPQAFVISLDRLPSHGRAIAEWVVEAKKRRHIPILFSGGTPEKVAATRKKFPDAVYCSTGEEVAALARVLGR